MSWINSGDLADGCLTKNGGVHRWAAPRLGGHPDHGYWSAACEGECGTEARGASEADAMAGALEFDRDSRFRTGFSGGD